MTVSSEPRPTPDRPWSQRLLAFLITWGPALAIMALIFRLSSDPDLGGPGWVTALAYRLLGGWAGLARFDPLLALADDYLSWGAHFTFYAGLALALLWALRRQWPGLRHPAWTAWLLTTLYGVSDEWHQSFVPHRAPDWRDVATDMAGAAVALGVVWVVRRVVGRRGG
jgi:VanZ family protein